MSTVSTYVGVAATWSMPNTENALSQAGLGAESSFALEHTTESVFDPDHRSIVDMNDFKDGGKYRCEFAHCHRAPESS